MVNVFKWLLLGVVGIIEFSWALVRGFLWLMPGESEPTRPWRDGVYRDHAEMADDETHTHDGRPIVD
jgi:hypothetical protein